MANQPDNDAVHTWAGLSYSDFWVVWRTAAQQMPGEWQRRFVALMDEMEKRFPDRNLTPENDDSERSYSLSLRVNGRMTRMLYPEKYRRVGRWNNSEEARKSREGGPGG